MLTLPHQSPGAASRMVVVSTCGRRSFRRQRADSEQRAGMCPRPCQGCRPHPTTPTGQSAVFPLPEGSILSPTADPASALLTETLSPGFHNPPLGSVLSPLTDSKLPVFNVCSGPLSASTLCSWLGQRRRAAGQRAICFWGAPGGVCPMCQSHRREGWEGAAGSVHGQVLKSPGHPLRG